MEQKVFAKIIAQRLGIAENNVAGVLALLEEGCTIPFIARYRKERTGGLDEVKIAAISDQFDKLKEMAKRKETIVKTITELEKMTPELQQRIDACWEATELEDRVKSVCETYHLSEADARRKIEDIDGHRAEYYGANNGKVWGQADNYDLCINTSVMGREGAAFLIRHAVEGKLIHMKKAAG